MVSPDPNTGGQYIVTVGTSSEVFTQSNGVFTPNVPSGSSLTFNSTSNLYTYTTADGTVVTFDGNAAPNGPAEITKIVKPSGETLIYTYATATVPINCQTPTFCIYLNIARPQSIGSNLGWQLHLSYVSDAPPTSTSLNSWLAPSKLLLLNLAADYCAPAAYSCSTTGAVQSISLSGQNGPYTATTYTDTAGQTTTLTYDTSGNLTALRLPGHMANDITIAYDANSRVSSVTNKGVQTSYVYADDTINGIRTTTVTDALNHSWVYKFALSDQQPISMTDPLGHTITKSYYSSRLLQSITSPEGNHTDYAYDSRGNVTSVTSVAKSGSGIANIVTSAAFPSACSNVKTCNKPTSTTDANGNVTSYTYDPNSGGVATVTLPAPTTGTVQPQTRLSYSAKQAYFKNSSGSIVASGQNVYLLTGVSQCQTTASCTGAADETKTTISYGPQTAGTANNLFPVSMTSGDGAGALSATTAFTYDTLGNKLTADGPLAGTADTTRYRYDADRQRIGVTSPNPGNGQPDRAIRITYNPDGQISKQEIGTVTDQSDAAWSNFAPLQTVDTGFDSYYRPITSKLSAGGTAYALTQTGYDGDGRLQCTAVRMNSAVYGSLPSSACTLSTQGSYGPDQISQTVYDTAGEVTQVQEGVGTSAAATERTIAYNPNGTVASLTDANGNVTSYTYDGLDRPIKTTYPATPAYPSGTTEQVTAYDNNGNAQTLVNRAGQSISLGYDALNRITSKSGAVATVNYGYDNLGRTLTTTFSSGQGITNTYDALSRLTSSSSNMGGTARQFSYQYDLAGRRTQMTYPDGYYLNYDYLTTGEVQKIRANGATSGINVLAIYAYDALGNRSSLTLGNGVVTSYGFDPVSRLTSLTHALAGTNGDLTKTFAYNPASAITTETRSNDAYAWTGAVNVNRNYTPNSLNQYASVAGTNFRYDVNGNLTSDGTNAFGYDAENRLTSATIGGATASLSYDPTGRLWDVVKGSTDLRFFYDGDHMAAHYDSSGNLQYRYVFGPGADEPLLQYNPSGIRTWYTADERGSIISNSDDSGTFALANTYDEYGIPGSANSGRFQYTGQMWVSELGMYFYKTRAYSPTLGRFMQTDPIGYDDGMNWYAYVHNDPVNGIDPTGCNKQATIPAAPDVRPCCQTAAARTSSLPATRLTP